MTELAETPERTDDALPLGPQSLVWRYFGDNRMYLIGPRPAGIRRGWQGRLLHCWLANECLASKRGSCVNKRSG